MSHLTFITQNSNKVNSHILLSTAIGDYEIHRKKGYSLIDNKSLPAVKVVNRSAILLLIIPIVIIDDFEQIEILDIIYNEPVHFVKSKTTNFNIHRLLRLNEIIWMMENDPMMSM